MALSRAFTKGRLALSAPARVDGAGSLLSVIGVYLIMRFVETPIFTKSIQRLIDDDDYRALQIALMLRPEQGPVIRGGGGLRKVRWARAGGGKSGGIRVIYYWARAESAFYMLYAYPKNEQEDLTPAQARVLGQLVREEFK